MIVNLIIVFSLAQATTKLDFHSRLDDFIVDYME